MSDTRFITLWRVLVFMLILVSGGVLLNATSPLVGQTAATQKVLSFTLINAVTDVDIATLTEDYVINCADIGTLKLNIRANTQPQVVGSVRFGLDDIANYNTENNPPYALGANNGNDYKAWTPTDGFHTLKATPYTDTNAQGVAGVSLTVHFIAQNCAEAPTATPTKTLPPGPTDTPTATPTGTLTDVPTDTPTSTMTATATATSTGTITEAPTATATITEITATPALTLTDTPTSTGTLPTATPTATMVDATATPTPSISATPVGVFELLRNGGFEEDAEQDKIPDYWGQKNATKDKRKCNKADKPPIAFEGQCVYQFKSGAGEKSRLNQSLSISSGLLPLDGLVNRAGSGDSLSLSGYVVATGDVKTKVKIRVIYFDGSLGKGKITVKTTTPTPIYQALAGKLTLVMAGEPKEIKVILQNRGLSGKVRYDLMSLLLKVE